MASQHQPKYLTPEGLAILQQELDVLKNERRSEIAAKIHKASESGGTAGNAEYEEVKEEQGFIEGRILDLENILADAVAAPKRRGKSKDVQFGSTVTVVTSEGKKQKYTLVGSAEAAPLEGKISVESPVGMALMGHKIGDEIEVNTPAGTTTLTISQVR